MEKPGYMQLSSESGDHDHSHGHTSAAPDDGGHDHSHAHTRSKPLDDHDDHDRSHGHSCEDHHDDHDHSHGHTSSRGDDHDDAETSKKLYTSLGLCALFMLVEFAGGIFGNSLAIITDALHMLTDVFSFVLAIYATYAAKQKATARFTFGFKRAEVISALLSTLLIWVLTAILLYEAICRIIDFLRGEMEDVNGALMFWIAVTGIGFNLVLAGVLGGDHVGHSHGGHSHGHAAHAPVLTVNSPVHGGHDHGHGHDGGHDHGHGLSEYDHLELGENGYGSVEATPRRNLNVDAAYLHVIGDLIQSIGVAIAGALIWYHPSWKIVDPLCTILFGFIVMWTTLQMLWSNISVLLEGVPEGVDLAHLKEGFLQLRGPDGVSPLVSNVHDLHVWSMSTGSMLLTVHMHSKHPELALARAHQFCIRNGLPHATIQINHSPACASGECCDQSY